MLTEKSHAELLQSLASDVTALCASVDRWLDDQTKLQLRVAELERQVAHLIANSYQDNKDNAE